MLEVVLLSLVDDESGGCACQHDGPGGAPAGQANAGEPHAREAPAGDPDPAGAHPAHGGDGGCATGGRGEPPRAAVRHCADVLGAAGARVTTVSATSDAGIDEVLSRFDGPARPDGLRWPAGAGGATADGAATVPRLIVAATDDAQLRAVVRRMVRRYAPPPSRRPDDLRADRTVADLPPVGILPLAPVGGTDLAGRLDLPARPEEVAAAVLAGRVRRLDLLRTDAGSVTLHGALVGGASAEGAAVPWRGTVQVDGKTLCSPDEPVLACAVANADGWASVDGLPLAPGADPGDGAIDVAVLAPVLRRVGLRRRAVLEVRRARGRAVAITPKGEVRYVDDGVPATLPRTRTWWVERGAWGVYTR